MGDPLGGGKLYFALVIVALISVFGMLLSPYANSLFRAVDTTAYTPLVEAAVKFSPYAFLFFIVYAMLTAWKTGGK